MTNKTNETFPTTFLTHFPSLPLHLYLFLPSSDIIAGIWFKNEKSRTRVVTFPNTAKKIEKGKTANYKIFLFI